MEGTETKFNSLSPFQSKKVITKMKLKDHIFKEYRTFRVEKNGKKYVCRVVTKDHRVAKYYRCTNNIYLDFTELFWLSQSRRYIMGRYQPIYLEKQWFGFDSFEDVITWLKENKFKIFHPRHKKKRVF